MSIRDHRDSEQEERKEEEKEGEVELNIFERLIDDAGSESSRKSSAPMKLVGI
jgi:hypothetical protein